MVELEKELELTIGIESLEIPAKKAWQVQVQDVVMIDFVLKGRGEHIYNDRVYPISKGNVFIVEAGASHGYKAQPNEAFEIQRIYLYDPILKRILEKLSGITAFIEFFYTEPFHRRFESKCSKVMLSSFNQMRYRKLLEELKRELATKETGYELMVESLVSEMLIFLSRCYEDMRRKEVEIFEGDEGVLEEICGFIRQHCREDLQLEDICRMAGMSISTFTLKFKEKNKETFLQYRNRWRLKLAIEYLEGTNRVIADIAQEVGFKDIAHFNRLFKRTYGMTPGSYRKKEMK